MPKLRTHSTNRLRRPHTSTPTVFAAWRKESHQAARNHKSTSTSPDGVEQQIKTFPAAGGSSGSG